MSESCPAAAWADQATFRAGVIRTLPACSFCKPMPILQVNRPLTGHRMPCADTSADGKRKRGDEMEALEAAADAATAAMPGSKLPGFVSAGVVQPERPAGGTLFVDSQLNDSDELVEDNRLLSGLVSNRFLGQHCCRAAVRPEEPCCYALRAQCGVPVLVRCILSSLQVQPLEHAGWNIFERSVF